MGRNNGNKIRGGSKPQQRKGGGGSKGSRQRNHFQSRVFGDTPLGTSEPKIESPKQNSYSRPQRPNVFRAPLPNDVVAIRNFVRDSKGRTKEKFKSGIKFGIITADLMDLIYSPHGPSDPDKLLEEFINQHGNHIPYEVTNLSSHREQDGSVLMRAVPNDVTRNALNQDILDAQTVFGIEEPFRHRALIIAKYPSMHDFTEAQSALMGTIERQGGVLLTFGGVQLPSTTS